MPDPRADIDEAAQTVEMAAEALLREHPDALVAGLASNGLIVPVPQTVGLWGQGAIEGRAVFDHIVADDRATVARMWVDLQRENAVAAKVRMLRRPTSWATLHFLDVTDVHGVVLAILLPGEEDATDGAEPAELAPAPPRFCSLMEDEVAHVVECDDAFTEMFGYTAEELIGKSVLDQIHPEDQGRAVEGWLSVLSTRRAQQTRLRRRRKDGTYMWVDTTLHNYLNQPDRNYVLVEIIDASAEMAAQEALQEREELLRRLTDAMPVGLLQLDTEERVVYNNARLLDILRGSAEAGPMDAASSGGTSSAERPATTTPCARELLDPLSEEGMAAFDSALGEVLAEGIDRDVEVDIELPSGERRRALMSLRALLRQSGEVSGAITCVLDITDSARARAELEQRATFDALTRCRNRSSILAAVQQELERGDGMTTGIIYVDLDNFKPVNDSLGHAAGDELLTHVAERLRLASRGNDDVGRLGGDEFLLLLREIPGPEMAMSIAERVCESLLSPFELSCGTIELGASIGVACARARSVSAEELVKRSDEAMYRSKERRRGAPVLAGSNGGAPPGSNVSAPDGSHVRAISS
jgi:diguanylate cyclase (GGDEF)-like protein/PAS domain S-box-containing protein